MSRIDTDRVVTVMANTKIGGDGAEVQLPREPMGILLSAAPYDPTVAVAIMGTSPQPARVGFLNALPESLVGGWGLSLCVMRCAVAPRRTVLPQRLARLKQHTAPGAVYRTAAQSIANMAGAALRRTELLIGVLLGDDEGLPAVQAGSCGIMGHVGTSFLSVGHATGGFQPRRGFLLPNYTTKGSKR